MGATVMTVPRAQVTPWAVAPWPWPAVPCVERRGGLCSQAVDVRLSSVEAGGARQQSTLGRDPGIGVREQHLLSREPDAELCAEQGWMAGPLGRQLPALGLEGAPGWGWGSGDCAWAAVSPKPQRTSGEPNYIGAGGAEMGSAQRRGGVGCEGRGGEGEGEQGRREGEDREPRKASGQPAGTDQMPDLGKGTKEGAKGIRRMGENRSN